MFDNTNDYPAYECVGGPRDGETIATHEGGSVTVTSYSVADMRFSIGQYTVRDWRGNARLVWHSLPTA